MEASVDYMNEMSHLSGSLELWVNDILVWIGFGTLVGLLARAIMPGRDPGGATATLGMGIGGVIIGCGVWTLATGGHRVTPVSPIGILVGTAGAFTLLFFYRFLGGYWFREHEGPVNPRRRRRRWYAYED